MSIAWSSTEAEYHALSKALKTIAWLCTLLNEPGIEQKRTGTYQHNKEATSCGNEMISRILTAANKLIFVLGVQNGW